MDNLLSYVYATYAKMKAEIKKKKVRYDNYTSVGALDCKIFPIVLIFRPCCLQATKRN